MSGDVFKWGLENYKKERYNFGHCSQFAFCSAECTNELHGVSHNFDICHNENDFHGAHYLQELYAWSCLEVNSWQHIEDLFFNLCLQGIFGSIWSFKLLMHFNTISMKEIFIWLFEAWWNNPTMGVCFCKLEINLENFM